MTVLDSDQYARYRLYARARRMGAFGYWAQFTCEDDREVIAQRWRSRIQDRLREVDD